MTNATGLTFYKRIHIFNYNSQYRGFPQRLGIQRSCHFHSHQEIQVLTSGQNSRLGRPQQREGSQKKNGRFLNSHDREIPQEVKCLLHLQHDLESKTRVIAYFPAFPQDFIFFLPSKRALKTQTLFSHKYDFSTLIIVYTEHLFRCDYVIFNYF